MSAPEARLVLPPEALPEPMRRACEREYATLTVDPVAADESAPLRVAEVPEGPFLSLAFFLPLPLLDLPFDLPFDLALLLDLPFDLPLSDLTLDLSLDLALRVNNAYVHVAEIIHW